MKDQVHRFRRADGPCHIFADEFSGKTNPISFAIISLGLGHVRFYTNRSLQPSRQAKNMISGYLAVTENKFEKYGLFRARMIQVCNADL